MGLTRDQILGAADLKLELVEVPEWGGAVYVRSLNGAGRDKFEASRFKMNGTKVEMIHENTRAALVALALCDESGAPLFSEADVAELGQKNAAALDRVFDVAQRLSGLRGKDFDEKLKNSGAALNGSSISG